MRLRRFFGAATACLLFLLPALLGSTAFAQTGVGSMAGTVYDPSNAAIPGANIAARNDSTGATFTTTSDAAGLYRFSAMTIGAYTVKVTAGGFKATTYDHVQITVGSVVPLDMHLTVGQTSETVTVNAEALTVQTETSDVSGVITANQIQNLPLVLGGMKGTRAPESFTYLLPGTVAFGTGGNGTGGGTATPGYNSKISGSQAYGSEVLLDGADTFRSENGSTFDETAPSVDAIQEFKVELSSPSAEYGRTTGGIELFSTKAGTNSFHGGLYDFLQNNDLNANTWFNNLNLATQPDTPANRALFATPLDKKNDFGGYIGGPVWLPKIYNGRNRTFFFFSWERFDQHQSATNRSFVPEPDWLTGNFADLLGPATGTINPCTGQPILTGQIFDPSTEKTVQTSNGPVTCRSPFPGNQVPVLSTVAKNIMALFPAPNLARANFSLPNYALSTTGLNLNKLLTVRIDQNVAAAHKLYFSYSSRENDPAVNLVFPLPLDTNSPQVFNTHFIRFGWDWTLSSSMVNNLVLGYNRTNSHNASQEALNGDTNWNSKLGLGGTPAAPTFPQLSFNGNDYVGGFGQNTNNDVIDNGYRVSESLDWLRGRHNLKFGGQWYLQLFDPLTKSGESGTFNFSRNETSAFPNNSSVTGNSFASFLLGQVDNGSLSDHRIQFKEISHYYNLFVEDDWKVNSQLTLNLGLSYSIDTPYRYADGNTSNIDLNTPNPGASGFPGALVFAGKGTGRNGNVNETWARRWDKNVAPRLGFAYAPDFLKGLTVLRGYYGIFYAPMTHGDFNVQNVDGFTANPSFSGNGFDQAFNWDNGFPSYTPPPNLDPAQDNFTSPGFILPSFGRPGMVQNWSLQVQQQLAPDLIFSLGYVGSRSEHLKSGFNFYNSTSPSTFAIGPQLGQSLSNLPGAPLPYANFPTSQNLGQSLRPHPQYLSLNSGETLENLGAGSFDALEATLQRRFHSGLTLLASYTFSKTMTDSESAVPFFASFVQAGSGAQDPNHLKYDKSISSQSLPNNFVLSYLYELPVGRGKAFLGNSNRAVNTVVSGWQIGGVQRYESGQPMNWGGATGVPGYDGSIHFLHNRSVPIYSDAWLHGHFNPLTDRMFNSHAFIDPNAQHDNLPDPVAARGGSYAFGDFERVSGDARTHAFLNEDFSINKRFPLFEKNDLMFQASLLDAFNRHVWSPPDPNPYGGSECQPGNTGCSTPYTFGQIGGTISGPRIIQLELRYEF